LLGGRGCDLHVELHCVVDVGDCEFESETR
jgi:hypothetical protein